MNKLKLLIVSLLFAGGVGIANADIIAYGQNHYTLHGDTHAQVFTGAGIVTKVLVGTGAAGAYVVVLDTVSTGNFTYTAINDSLGVSAQKITPQLPFFDPGVSSATAVGYMIYDLTDQSGDGVRFNNGLAVFNNSSINTVTVYWKQSRKP